MTHDGEAASKAAAGDVPGLRRWLGSSSWTLVEQVLFSLSNFGVSILLARTVSREEYGSFAIAFAVWGLLASLQNSVFIEPLLVLQAGRHRQAPREHLRGVVQLQARALVPTLAVTVLFAVGFVRLNQFDMAWVAGGLTVALPGLMLVTLLRRACLAQFRGRQGATGGLLQLSTALGAMLLLHTWGGLTATSGLAILGASGLVTAWLYARTLGLFSVQAKSPPLGALWGEYWSYGRMGLPSAVFSWAAFSGSYLLLPALGAEGVAASGVFRAGMNLSMPLVQINGALGVALIATLSHQRATGATTGLRRFVAVFLAINGFYLAALAGGSRWLLQLVYGDRYDILAPFLWVFGAVPLVTSGVTVLRARFLLEERPQIGLWSSLAAALVGLASTPALVARWGSPGAAYAILLAALAQFAVALSLSLQRRGTQKNAQT